MAHIFGVQKNIETTIWGLALGNGKENENYYSGLRVLGMEKRMDTAIGEEQMGKNMAREVEIVLWGMWGKQR